MWLTPKKEQHNDFFVSIADTITFRRSILESIKITIKQLQAYERFKDLRDVKGDLIKHLRELMKDIDRCYRVNTKEVSRKCYDIVDTYLIIPALDLELPRTSNIIIVDRKYYEHSQSMLLLLSSKTLRVG